MHGRRTRSQDLWALRDLDLEIEPGNALGVVGANGAGKSTLLKILAGIIPPDRGTVEVSGRVVSLLELGAGFHPDFTGRENVELNASIHGVGRREIAGLMDEIIAFSELERFIDAPLRTYSTGMYTRLGFAVATSLRGDMLLLDEVLAVGDEAFQQKCVARIAEYQHRGTTIVFVSHAATAVERVCNRAIWISGGELMYDGTPADALRAYRRGLTAGAEEGEVAIEDLDWNGARIAGVRCTDGDSPGTRFLSGEPFAIEVDYEVVADVTPIVTLTITTVEGALIAATDNRVDIEPGGLPPGPRTARLLLESLPLQEGAFTMNVSLQSENGVVYHNLDRCAPFTVIAQLRGYGPVALDGRWQVSVVESLSGAPGVGQVPRRSG